MEDTNSKKIRLTPISDDASDAFSVPSLELPDYYDEVAKETRKTNDFISSSNDNQVPIIESSTKDLPSDTNYVFYFGRSASGKSVIQASMWYHMEAKVGHLLPNNNIPSAKEAERMFFNFKRNFGEGKLPPGDPIGQVKCFHAVFHPRNKSVKVPPVNISFLATAGGDLDKVENHAGFIPDIDNILRNRSLNVSFILVTSYDTASQDDNLMSAFFYRLSQMGRTIQDSNTNVILLISKWDKSGESHPNESALYNFISYKMPQMKNLIDQYDLPFTYYTVGNVSDNLDEGKPLNGLDLNTAESLTNWLYLNINPEKKPLDYRGTWMEQQFGFSKK